MQQHDGMSVAETRIPVLWLSGPPGDPLPGQPPEILPRAADRAAAGARTLERAMAGTVRIDTDGRTVTEAVDAIAALTS
jgi:hypothetical protein